MIAPILIRGFACPYSVAAIVECGVTELIRPGAFSEQVENQLDCSVKLDSHDDHAADVAYVNDGTLMLFETDYGLAFECHVLPDREDFGSVAWEIRNRRYDKVSVNFRLREIEFSDDGTECVTRAEIDHLCLTNSAAYGNWTAAWEANRPLDTGNSRIVMMADRWQTGFRAHLNAKSEKAAIVKPAMAARSRVVMSADTRAAEQRLAEQLKEHSHRSAALLRETILGRLARTESK